MRTRDKKSIEEIRELQLKLISNIGVIRNNNGRANVKIMIDTLKSYLENPVLFMGSNNI